MRKIVSLAGICGMMLVMAAPAQEPMKPGPEHDKLKAHEGTWDATVLSNGKESKGVMTAKMGMGNFWLVEHFQGEVAGSKFEGHGLTGYDPQKKKYVNLWVDSMTPTAMISEGNHESDNRLVLKGKMATPDGKSMDFTMTTVRKDSNNMVVTAEGTGPDGKSMEFIKVTYKRRQK